MERWWQLHPWWWWRQWGAHGSSLGLCSKAVCLWIDKVISREPSCHWHRASDRSRAISTHSPQYSATPQLIHHDDLTAEQGSFSSAHSLSFRRFALCLFIRSLSLVINGGIQHWERCKVKPAQFLTFKTKHIRSGTALTSDSEELRFYQWLIYTKCVYFYIIHDF